jgi:hypothetical protein
MLIPAPPCQECAALALTRGPWPNSKVDLIPLAGLFTARLYILRHSTGSIAGLGRPYRPCLPGHARQMTAGGQPTAANRVTNFRRQCGDSDEDVELTDLMQFR